MLSHCCSGPERKGKIRWIVGLGLSPLFLCCSVAFGQQYVISTIAGGVPPTPALATAIAIPPPSGIAIDSKSNVFFSSNNCIFKLDPSDIVTRVAGSFRLGFSGDGGPALNAQFNLAGSLAFDKYDNLYVADQRNLRIRRISPAGIITTVAGNGSVDALPPTDGVPAVSTGMRHISALALNDQGEIIFADLYTVRKISTGGILSTIAGGGSDGAVEGEIATQAALLYPDGLAVDGNGNVFVSDSSNRVRKIDSQGIITTVAGTGANGFSGDGGPATQAQFAGPAGLSIDKNGALYIVDRGNYRIRKVSRGGIISTVAGGGEVFPGDGSTATLVDFCDDGQSLSGISLAEDGSLYTAACWIQKITPDGVLLNVAGNGLYSFGGDGGPAVNAQFYGTPDLAVDQDENLFIADYGNSRIRKVGPDGNIITIAGSGDHGFAGDGGPAISALLNHPAGIAFDANGNFFIVDYLNFRIRKVAPDGTITTIAGNGGTGFTPDGGKALGASIWARAIAIDDAGSVLFIEGFRVRKIGPDGLISTVAGNGTEGSSGDGGPATDAQLDIPSAIAFDRNNNLLIAETLANRIRIVSPDGKISTIAGNGSFGSFGDAGDGGLAIAATITGPTGLATDADDNIFIADIWGLRRISASGIISTLARNSNPSQSSGDGGPAALAFLTPGVVKVDGAGRVYVTDPGYYINASLNSVVRLLEPTHQTVIISSVRDAASQLVEPVSPGKIVTVYGVGMGPESGVQNQGNDGVVSSSLAGTQVLFDGIAAPVLYTSSTQIKAVAPYATFGDTTSVIVSYNGATSAPYSLSTALSAPGIFTSSSTGSGQVAGINGDGFPNSATHPVKIGDFLSLYATGEGQTRPAGVDGKMAGILPPFTNPLLPVTVQIGGIPATVIYAGGAPGQVAGVMQLVVQIPTTVLPGGYVPLEIAVGANSTIPGATWIAVSGK